MHLKPTPKDEAKTKALLELVLEGKSEKHQLLVWQIVSKFDVDANDPMFFILLAVGNLEVYLEQLPAVLDRSNARLDELVATATSQYDRTIASINDLDATLKQAERRISRIVDVKFPPSHAPSAKQRWMRFALVGILSFLAGSIVAAPVSQALCDALPLCGQGEKP